MKTNIMFKVDPVNYVTVANGQFVVDVKILIKLKVIHLKETMPLLSRNIVTTLYKWNIMLAC